MKPFELPVLYSAKEDKLDYESLGIAPPDDEDTFEGLALFGDGWVLTMLGEDSALMEFNGDNYTIPLPYKAVRDLILNDL